MSSLSDTVLDRGLGEITSARSRLAAREAAMVAEIGQRKGNAREKLREQSRMSANDARRAVQTSEGLEELPATRTALEAGSITPENARLLARSANERKGTDTPVDETELVPKATEQAPDKFAKTLRRWETLNRPDTAKEKLQQQHKARKVSMWEDTDSGMYILRGEFDPVTGARISGQLAAMTDRLWRDEHGKNPVRPQSTVKQRRADALTHLLRGEGPPASATESTRGMGPESDRDGPCASGRNSPHRAQVPPRRANPSTTLLVITDLDTVSGQLDNGRLANGTPLPTEEIARLACEADIVPAFFDSKGQPLWLGHKTRLATPAQRLAVIARDQGCIACDAAPEWCQVHHIEWWRQGGPTDIDNLCLLCSQHHHLVHDGNTEIIRPTDGDAGFRLRRRPTRPARGASGTPRERGVDP